MLCTELASNLGQSVTNAAETIASEVATFNRLPLPVVWVEYYEEGPGAPRRTRTASTW